jgi:hypothetical protein
MKFAFLDSRDPTELLPCLPTTFFDSSRAVPRQAHQVFVVSGVVLWEEAYVWHV